METLSQKRDAFQGKKILLGKQSCGVMSHFASQKAFKAQNCVVTLEHVNELV